MRMMKERVCSGMIWTSEFASLESRSQALSSLRLTGPTGVGQRQGRGLGQMESTLSLANMSALVLASTVKHSNTSYDLQVAHDHR